MTDDAVLVERAQAGDASAFAELYERYFDRIHDFLARMVRDRAEAADLTQDTFLRAMNSLSTLANGASFKSWLFTIARNTALNRLERSARTRPLERTNDEGDEYSYDVVDADRFGSPEEAAEAASLAALVWDAAAALEPRYYSVLHLTVREGLDSAEIAEAMGVTRNNAYVLVNRMKKALEDAVGALALYRGRHLCAELDRALATLEVGEMSPEARRLIDRHMATCDECTERRTRLASPFAAFAALAPLHAEASVKASILAQVHAAFEAGGTAGGSGGGGGGQDPGSPESLSWPPGGPDETVIEGGRGSSSVTANTLEGRARLGRRRILLGAAGGAALFLLLGGSLAFALRGGGGSEDATPTPEPPSATIAAGGVPSSTATALPAFVTTTGTPTPTATPSPSPSPAATEGGPGSSLRSGIAAPTATTTTGLRSAEATSTPPEPTSTPSAAPEPAPTEPPLVAPEPTAAPEPPTPPPPTSTPAACTSELTTTPAAVTFTEPAATQTVVLHAPGCIVAFAALPGASWLSVDPPNGAVPAGGNAAILVSVDFEDRSAKSSRVQLVTTAGTLNILVTVVRAAPTATPTPTATPGNPGAPGDGLVTP